MKSLIVIIFLLLGMTSTSHAGFEPETYSFSPTIGFYDFDSHQGLKTGVAMGLRVSRYLTSRLAVEALGLLISAEAKTDEIAEHRNVAGLLYNIDGLYHFPVGDKWRPFLAVGFGGITVKGNVTGENNNLGLNYGGGIKYLLSDQVALRADIRQVLVNDSHIEHDMFYTMGLEVAWGGRPHHAKGRAMAGTDLNISSPQIETKETKPDMGRAIVDLPPTPAVLLTMKSTVSDTTIVSAGGIALADSDKDGVPDSHDLCANTASGVGVDQDGCAIDSDSDGVSDHLDKCSATPAGLMTDKSGCTLDTDLDTVPDSRDYCADTPEGVVVNAKGCPPPQDSDGDKVFDGRDKCPATQKGLIVGNNGCALDTDKDGIPDSLDACSATGIGVAVNAKGCALDQDGDGVLESFDWCPGTPGDVAVDSNGCQVLISFKKKTATELHIRFENGKAGFSPAFMDEVMQIAEYLNKFPETMIEIEGHSDNTGPKSLNEQLSLKRAESLKSALITRFGIEASRMMTRAYGFARPIADNSTAEGRKKNRRVVVILNQP